MPWLMSFLLPCSDCAAAMARLFLSMLVLGQYDSTWLYAPGYMWSIIEVSTGVIGTCLPTMRVLLKTVFGGRFARFFGMSSGRASHLQSRNMPWLRSGGTGENSASAHPSGHRLDGISDSQWGVSSQKILVTEEVNIELGEPNRQHPQI